MKRVNQHERWHYPQSEPKVVNPHRLRSQVKALAYLESYELVTPCRLFGVLLGSIALVLLISFSASDGEFSYEYVYDPSPYVNMSRRPYVYDHKLMALIREDKASLYGYDPGNMNKVEKRSQLDLNEFWDLYDGKWPVIVTDIVPNWTAYKEWGKDFFINKYGIDRVILKAVQGKLQDGVAHVRELTTFIGLLDQPASTDEWTYLEDEMFLVLRPELKQHVGANYLMDENFFSLFPSDIRPWDCMMLWGTKYSRSTLHMDPYNWTAVSAVIWGRKKWKLFPPGQDQFLYIEPKRRCGFPLDCNKYDSQVDAFDVDYWKYPKFRRAEYIEVEQTSGELLVIPTGWYHQAYNDEETLSISLQLMNRNNHLAILEEIIKGKNLSRKKLPPHFNTLLPPDQVKMFMSLLPKKILQTGRDVTKNIMESLDLMRNKTNDLLPT